jgi:hypothetical protein
VNSLAATLSSFMGSTVHFPFSVINTWLTLPTLPLLQALMADSLSKMERSRLRVKFHVLINQTFQMMFVSGETADVAPETTSMIEFIVQQQVMEMVSPHTHMHAII